MPHGIDLSLAEKVCEIFSCVLFVSIPVTTILLLINFDATLSRLLTVVLVVTFCLLAFIITLLALYRVYGKRARSPYSYEKPTISTLVSGNAVATGQLVVQYKLTDLDLQLAVQQNNLNSLLPKDYA